MKILGEEHNDDLVDTQHYLYEAVERFIREHNITTGETIFQFDPIGEAALDFIHELCEIVGYVKGDEEE